MSSWMTEAEKHNNNNPEDFKPIKKFIGFFYG